MSFISSVKKALGFPDEYDDDFDGAETDILDDADDTDDVTEQSKPMSTNENDRPSAQPQSHHNDTAAGSNIPTTLPGKIFDAVIDLFNATQPEFVSQCLNTEAQRKYIYDHIDKSLRDALEQAASTAHQCGSSQWSTEKQQLNAEINRLKNEFDSIRQQREEFQNAQLSIARQKRALSERVHDLENQVNTLTTEREQMQLENRSLQSRLRAAGVRAAASGIAIADVPEPDPQLQQLTEENTSLKEEVTRLTTALNEANDTIAQLHAEIDSIGASANESIEQQKEQEAALAQIEQQLQQFELIKKKKDTKISELQSAIKRKEAHINELENQLAKRDDEIKKSAEEKDSLRRTIQENLYAQASSEDELKQEIVRLKELVNAGATKTANTEPNSSSPKQSPKQRKSRDKKAAATTDNKPAATTAESNDKPSAKFSAIDELMDSTDWFVAPDPVPLKKDPEVEEDFGYKEPVKKASRDNDKQLSLF